MPPRRTTPTGYEVARKLRKGPTPAERKLWAYLRGNKLHGVNFRRQHAIGKYVPDFCSVKAKLIIELDGSQHLKQEEYDNERTRYLESQGYRVIRFWNNQVLNDIEAVVRAIAIALESNEHDSRG
ncbi:MAG: endonuclease domain-containing protein [Chloroflexi bacterium]|nr:endonuclease domain-containing protein [Chloroflexota bacterium]